MRSTGPVVAIVPARAGSKGIPGKNLRTVAGRSLVRRAVESARAASTIDTVVVSTDGDAIAAEAVSAGARVVRRPAALAGDEASSESAVLHVLDALTAAGEEPEVVVFLQATSPFTDPADLDAAVARVRDGHADSVFAATPSHAFLWRVDGDSGTAVAVNHDDAVRPRRQDRAPEYRETGAFYVFRAAAFRQHRHRFHGRVELAVVDPRGAVDIDDSTDLRIAEALAGASTNTAGTASASTSTAGTAGASTSTAGAAGARTADPHPDHRATTASLVPGPNGAP